MTRYAFGLFVLLALGLPACGGDGGSVEVEPDETVLQITSEGGFVPVEVALANGPRYTLLGDGSLIFQGVQTMEFPGPLLPPYFVAHLDSNQMNAVLAMVEEIGLPDIEDETDDSAADFVADASTEVIRYWDENGSHRLAVYALGIEPEPTERNAAFLELIETFDRFTAQAESEPYQPERVRVLAGPGGGVEPEFEDVRPWPLPETDLSEWVTLPNDWQCETFDASVIDPFETATQTTTWEHPDGSSDPVKLVVRALHPGEPDCPQ
jgi:hypothetical protein